MRTHQQIDRRSLAMHREVARKLMANPTLLEKAFDNIRRWEPTSGGSKPYLNAWRAILALPVEEIARAIVEDSERMTALRQNSPFAGVLTPRERWAIYRKFEQEEEEAGRPR